MKTDNYQNKDVVTMNCMYRDGSNNICRVNFGYCKDCGDCECYNNEDMKK